MAVRHQLWVIDEEARIDALTAAFDALPALYIADGHHRSAAAAREARARGTTSSQFFLSVLFPQHEMTILDYNRVLKDLNGMSRRGVPRRRRRAIHGDAVRASPSARPRPASSACIWPAAGTG